MLICYEHRWHLATTTPRQKYVYFRTLQSLLQSEIVIGECETVGK